MDTHTNKAHKAFSERYNAVCNDLNTLREMQRRIDDQIEDVQRTKYALERALGTLLPGVTKEEPLMPQVTEEELIDQRELAESFKREMEHAAE